MSKVVISIDLDAFYCAVEQHYDSSLTDLPFIVYQKNCIATLSYPAREMGLKKLGSVSEAVKKFPGIKLVNGESLVKYRAEGKRILDFVSELFNQCAPIERLGLEELRIDLTKVIDYNMENLRNMGILEMIKKDEIDDEVPEGVYLFLNDGREVDNAANAEPFFCEGFFFNVPAKVFPYERNNSLPTFIGSDEHLRLYIGAQLAGYVMERIGLDMGYNCSIGIGPNKTIAKMVCSLNKPKGLTVVLPEYVQDYLDDLLISRIPGFGHKTVKKIEEDITRGGERGGIFMKKEVDIEEKDEEKEKDKVEELGELSEVESSSTALDVHTNLTVHHVRTKKTKMDFIRLFGQKQGDQLWDLLHGIDNSAVKIASDIPSQISIEDTYKRLDTMNEVTQALTTLLKSLIRQIYSDLIDSKERVWRTYPTTFRLSISRSDGNPYAMRKSKSCHISMYFYEEIFSESTNSFETIVERLSERLLQDVVIDLFNELSNARSGERLNVRLLNVAVTNFVDDKPTVFRRTTKKARSSKQSRGIMDRFLSMK